MPEVTVRLPTLHPGQLKARQAFLDHQTRFGLVMCGRQWGKSTDGGEWVAEGALAGEPCGWFAPTFKYLAPVWRDLKARLGPACRKVDEQEKRLELLTGGVIEFWSLDTPNAGRGRHYKRLVVDEAGIVRDLLEAWQEALYATLIRLKGSARLYGTPKGRQHGFVQLFSRGEAGKSGWHSIRAATLDNPYIPPSEIEEARRNLPPAVFAQEFEGIPADDGGNPFGLDNIRACFTSLIEKPGKVVAWGWDFARAQDYTVGIGLDAHWQVVQAHRWQKPWGETISEVKRIVGSVPSWGDSTGVGDPIVEALQRMGCPILPVTFTASHRSVPEAAVSPGSKQRLMERLARVFSERLPRYSEEWLKGELESFGYEYTRNGVKYSAPDGLHDDGVMGLALAAYGREQLGDIREEPIRKPWDVDTQPGFDYATQEVKRWAWKHESREGPYRAPLPWGEMEEGPDL